ncbi:toprim domain-containing protein [Paracoccaceae bacterium GXU_MW_L88]
MNAREITMALHGKWYRRYGIACCPAHGDRKPSLTLADGNEGRLLLSCKAGCDFLAVLNALRSLGIMNGREGLRPTDPIEMAKREIEERAAAERTARKALATWKEALPIAGTIAETYLRNRGITCTLPATLRFHPECWHPSAKRFPTMIALVEGLPLTAIHRTYLRPDGEGKADVHPQKAMQGACAGGAVRLARADGPLVVAEGIETALSLCSGLLHRPATIWAALSAPGIAALRLPDQPKRLTIAIDGDATGMVASNKLAERAYSLGWNVRLLPAPEGKDWNDILMMKDTRA